MDKKTVNDAERRRVNDTRHPSKGLGLPLAAPAADQPEGFQAWPSTRHHRSGKTTVVQDQAEHDALMADPDWAETPAAFLAVPQDGAKE